MTEKYVNTVVVGGGQAGLAMSEHLTNHNVSHVVFERDRIAERWRVDRWDSLVANGPAWHDRFPSKEFADCGPDEFPTKHSVVSYFEEFVTEKKVPIHCGVTVLSVTKTHDGESFRVTTTDGEFLSSNVVAATGAFQNPSIPPLVPEQSEISQIHSTEYRSPSSLAEGAVLVVGAGSSGSQIAEELCANGRKVYLSVGAHDRPPRQYRGKDFVWWLGVLGKWEMKSPPVGAEHVTIAVSGANGGRTVDFRRFANDGITLVGMTQSFENGSLIFASDLAKNIRQGDANYLSVLDEADAYVESEGLDLPLDAAARKIGTDPDCMTTPLLHLDLVKEGVTTIIWATGFTQNFDWLKVDAFDDAGKPDHINGVSKEPGIYFLGLPWLSMRGSSFIWGVWVDAKNLASHIAKRVTSCD